jgi:hypothetical protein
MKMLAGIERLNPLRDMTTAVPKQDCFLNISVVYEDALTREWAGEVFDRVANLVDPEATRSTWWKMADLSQPAVLAGAVSTTMRADIIMVATHAAEGFSFPFYVWVDSWLPYHRQQPGALVALIGMPERPIVQLDRAREYLRTVARQGRLDFMIEERKLSLPRTEVSTKAKVVANGATQQLGTGPWKPARGVAIIGRELVGKI